MAKLNDVKILDAEDGVIHRIEHEGVSYVKSEVGKTQEGDIVEVIESWGDIRVGDYYSVEEVSESYGLRFVHVQDTANCYEKRIIPYRKEVEEIEIGDIVVITDNSNGSFNEVGDIGEVTDMFFDDIVVVEVPERPYISRESGERGSITLVKDLRKANEREIEEFKIKDSLEHRKFYDRGREYMQFKKGDIVKIFISNLVEGIVGEVTLRGTMNGSDCMAIYTFLGEYYPAFSSRGDTAEIICFREDRQDLDWGRRKAYA